MCGSAAGGAGGDALRVDTPYAGGAGVMRCVQVLRMLEAVEVLNLPLWQLSRYSPPPLRSIDPPNIPSLSVTSACFVANFPTLRSLANTCCDFYRQWHAIKVFQNTTSTRLPAMLAGYARGGRL